MLITVCVNDHRYAQELESFCLKRVLPIEKKYCECVQCECEKETKRDEADQVLLVI